MDDRSKPKETAKYGVCAGIASRTLLRLNHVHHVIAPQLEEVTQNTHGQVGEYFHIQRVGAEADEANRRRESLDQRVLVKQAAESKTLLLPSVVG